MCFATCNDLCKSLLSSVTSLTIPNSKALEEDMLSLPNKIIVFAAFIPITQGRSIVTIPAPNFSSGSPKNESLEQIVRSHASDSSNAPAKHAPLTAAIVGFGLFQKRIIVLWSSSRIGFHCSP